MNGTPELQQTIAVREILSILFLRKWTIIVVFLSVVIAAAFAVYYLISPTYQSSSTIIINAQDVVLPVVEGIPASDFEKLATFHTQKDIMRSAQIAAQVVDTLDLEHTRVIGRIEQIKIQLRDIKRTLGKWLGIKRWQAPEDYRALAIDAVMKSLEIEGKPESQAIKLTFSAKDPDEAANTLNALIQAYQSYFYERLKQRAQGMLTYLESQVVDVNAQLAATERSLLAFKQADRVDLTSSRGGQSNLGLVGITDNPQVQNELKMYLLAMEDELRKLLADVTEKDPRVIKLRQKIRSYSHALSELPDRELSLLRLRREYEIEHETAVQLRKNIEKAKIITSADTTAVRVITVVDPADANDDPASPKPRLAMIVAVVFGLAFGLVLALVRHYLDHTVRSPADLQNYLGLKPLGSLRSVR